MGSSECQQASEIRRRADMHPAAMPLQVSAKKVGVSLWPHYHIFNAFLIFLFCLHLFWCAPASRHPCNRAQERGTEGRDGVANHPASA